MLKADLTFNAWMIVVDLAAFAWLRFSSKRNIQWHTFVAIAGCLLSTGFAMAVLVKAHYGLRDFATLRFTGMILFWHLPIFLSLGARIMRFPFLWFGIVLLMISYVYAYFVEPRWLEVTRHPVSVFPVTRTVRIAQMSDIQADSVGAFEERVLKTLEDLRPDLVFYTGDYIHCWSRNEYAIQARRLNALLRNMKFHPPLGSYAIRGDSDFPEHWKEVFDQTGVILMDDEIRILSLYGASVNLIALSPRRTRARVARELEPALKGMDETLPEIWLGHSPDFVRALEDRGKPFLALAGHTHGGQVQLPWIGALLTLSYLPRRYAEWYGPYGPGILSVSRGIGMERCDAPRLRFLCRPEIRLLQLE